MKTIQVTLITALSSILVLGQSVFTPPIQRQVQGQTIISNELPAADFTFDKNFRYVGGQVVNLYGNADGRVGHRPIPRDT